MEGQTGRPNAKDMETVSIIYKVQYVLPCIDTHPDRCDIDGFPFNRDVSRCEDLLHCSRNLWSDAIAGNERDLAHLRGIRATGAQRCGRLYDGRTNLHERKSIGQHYKKHERTLDKHINLVM